jgi:hypothetical protein
MLFYPIGRRTHSVGVTGKLGIPVHSLGSTLRPCHLQLNRGAAHLEINFAVYSEVLQLWRGDLISWTNAPRTLSRRSV